MTTPPDMTPQRWRSICEAGGVVDLSSRAKWRLSGSDRVRYLNGQVTNDVRRASSDAGVYACVTDVKGRIAGDVFIHAAPEGDSLLIDAEAELREPLGVRLERYIVADDAELVDVSEEWRLLHFFGAARDLAPVGGVSVQRFGVEGVDVWLPTSAPLPELEQSRWLAQAEVECLRILGAVPRFPNELNGETFPPEALLDGRAMDYAKGCYIGQEVLSRIRTTRKMPRELVFWQAELAETAIVAGDRLFLPCEGQEPKPAGRVTSLTRHPETGLTCGLAFIRQGQVPVDSRLLVGTEVATIDAVLVVQPTPH